MQKMSDLELSHLELKSLSGEIRLLSATKRPKDCLKTFYSKVSTCCSLEWGERILRALAKAVPATGC